MISVQSDRPIQQFVRPLVTVTKQIGLAALAIGMMSGSNAAFAGTPANQLELRVAIEQDVSQVTIGSSTDALLLDGSGQLLAEIPGMGALIAESENGQVSVNNWDASQIWVEPADDGYVFIGDSWYRGRTLVVPTSGGITAVNYVDLEEYLYSVLGGEMPVNWPMEALKAQAVAARTYALYQRQTSGNTVYDLGDTTSWQVYEGLEDEAPSTQQAVAETRGQVLTHNGNIIEAVFHSASGGHTENVEEVWVSHRPYLRAVPDYDNNSPDFRWTEQFSAAQLQSVVPGIGNILSMTPDVMTARGRVSSMRVQGTDGSQVVSGAELRSALNLRSTLFTVTAQPQDVAAAGDELPAPSTFTFEGGGFGHGLGLSQWGAYGLAQEGYNYQQIVLHYYTDATLAVIEVE